MNATPPSPSSDSAGGGAYPVEVTCRDQVAVLTLNLPDRGNPIDIRVARALETKVAEVTADPELRCLVLEGAGASFSVGGDLRALAVASAEEVLELNRAVLRVGDALAAARIPSIAAIHGNACGGGLELALACSLRVAAPDARLGLPEARLGLIAASGGLERLPRLIGRGPALRMLLTAEPLDVGTALALGLIDDVAEDGDVRARAFELAAVITANAPLAIAGILAATAANMRSDERRALIESRLEGLLESADFAEGVDAFLARRSPRFEGR